MLHRSGWGDHFGIADPRAPAPMSPALLASSRKPRATSLVAGLRQKKTRRRWLVSYGLVLCGLFDDLETVAFCGNHSESASVVPLDVDCA